MYHVLASLAAACNDHFTMLLLPAAITIDLARRLLILPHDNGEDLGDRWDETDGGAMLLHPTISLRSAHCGIPGTRPASTSPGQIAFGKYA